MIGTYKLYQIIENGKTYELGDEWDEKILTKDFYTLELYEDESFLMTSNGNDSFFVQGTWKQSENTLILTPAPQYGNPMSFTYDKNQQTLTAVGDDFGTVLKKE